MTQRPFPYAGTETRTRRITTVECQTSIPYSENEFLTVAQAAKFANCSVSTIRNLYRRCPIAKNVLGSVKISRSALLECIENGLDG
jgi:hypothetical protein